MAGSSSMTSTVELLGTRKAHSDRGTRGARRDPEVTVVQSHDRHDDREAETRTRVGCARREQGMRRRGKSRTIVRDRDLDRPVDGADTNMYASTRRRMSSRVVEQVVQQLV